MNNGNTSDFSEKIERIAKIKNISHIDAILWYCYHTGFEMELVSKSINKSLKTKLEKEGIELNLIKKE